MKRGATYHQQQEAEGLRLFRVFPSYFRFHCMRNFFKTDWKLLSMNKIILTSLLILLSTMQLSHASEVMKGEFRSMSTCLSSIESHSGKKIDRVGTDRPDKVSGFLSNGKHFACTRKSTGSKGTYYEGYYNF